MTVPVLACQAVSKNYHQGPQAIVVLENVKLEVLPAQRIAIVGASGSGKSTLLNVLGGLDKPDTGEVSVLGQNFSSLSDNQRGELRNRHLGFVYQFHHLLPEFSALENVAMPLYIAGLKKTEANARARDLLQRVGLQHRERHKPSALSGGERQRVAIARALANRPQCVLMDEPTGNLDSHNAKAIQQLMQRLSDELKTSFIVVTHDEQLAQEMDMIYTLADGALHQAAVVC